MPCRIRVDIPARRPGKDGWNRRYLPMIWAASRTSGWRLAVGGRWPSGEVLAAPDDTRGNRRDQIGKVQRQTVETSPRHWAGLQKASSQSRRRSCAQDAQIPPTQVLRLASDVARQPFEHPAQPRTATTVCSPDRRPSIRATVIHGRATLSRTLPRCRNRPSPLWE